MLTPGRQRSSTGGIVDSSAEDVGCGKAATVPGGRVDFRLYALIAGRMKMKRAISLLMRCSEG